MTRRLYYDDSYLKEAQSTIVALSDGGRRVTLDQTIFYATSGGQPHDLGMLNEIPVVDVVDEGDDIAHVLAAPLAEGLPVCGQIEWPRRYDHMQQHTGQHLLSAAFEELFGIPTLSFRMGPEASTVELGTKDLTVRQIESVALRATELARGNPGIHVSFEDAAGVEGLRKATQRAGTVRIVEIAGIDRSACGGTHVAALGEVLPLQLRDVDKVRGNARVSFVCGNRALARCQRDFQALATLARRLSTSFESVEAQVGALQKRLAEVEKLRQRLETDAATRAGVDLYTGSAPDEGGMRRVLASEPAIDETSRTKAKAFASRSKALLLLHSSSDVLLACSADSGFNAGAVLQQALTKVGARGGGSATLAQGSLRDQSILADLKSVLGFI